MDENGSLEKESFPRLLRLVESPLALYLRPGRNDHGVLAQALTGGLSGLRGIVFNPGRLAIQKDLHDEASRRRIESILDTRMLELDAPTGSSAELSSVGWAAAGRKTAMELKAAAGKEAAQAIADCVMANSFSAVLEPTHYLAAGAINLASPNLSGGGSPTCYRSRAPGKPSISSAGQTKKKA